MLGSIGMPELMFILLLALIVFGPRRLPEMGKTLGRALSEFRKASADFKRSVKMELSEDPSPPPAEKPAAPPE